MKIANAVCESLQIFCLIYETKKPLTKDLPINKDNTFFLFQLFLFWSEAAPVPRSVTVLIGC